MPQRQTRKQASKARDTPVSSDEEHDMKLNGNGTAHHASDASGDGERENIFLFWPNIIGMPQPHLHCAVCIR